MHVLEDTDRARLVRATSSRSTGGGVAIGRDRSDLLHQAEEIDAQPFLFDLAGPDRVIVMPLIETSAPVGPTPMNSPTCRPRKLNRGDSIVALEGVFDVEFEWVSRAGSVSVRAKIERCRSM